MSGNARRANGNARDKALRWARATLDRCQICGRPIDKTLPCGHPMSFEVDEVVPVSKGGSPTDRGNLGAAHRICNQRRGDRPLAIAQMVCAEMGAEWFDTRTPPRWNAPSRVECSRRWL